MRLNFRTKLAAILMLTVFITALGTGVYAIQNTKVEIAKSIKDKLQSDLALSLAYLDAQYPGDWREENGVLYKGQTVMNDNNALVDKVAKLTGDSVTLFLGNKRIATTVLKRENSRAVGTEADSAVTRQVLQEGRTFVGEATVVGQRFHAAYEPIRDAGGKIIGMWFVGNPYFHLNTEVMDLAWKLFLTMLLGQLAANVLAWLVARKISNPIRELQQAMCKAEKGDLTGTVRMHSKDELGQLAAGFNTMMKNLAAVINQVFNTAVQLASSAQQLSAGAEESSRATEQIASTISQVAHGTDSQAKSVEETANIVGQLSRGAQQIAANAHEMLLASNEASSLASMGGMAIEDTVMRMHTINESVASFAHQIKSLGARSLEIGKIVDVITGIAKQTNLLALNAAIEAARAGEHGRGFAVVADEVRKLAEQSGEAATQIASLIKEIQVETVQAVKAMEERTQEVAEGTVVVTKAGEAFQEILESISKVNSKIAEVSSATEEMATGGQEIVNSIENIAAISEETAASAQQVAVAAEQQTAAVQEVAASAEMLTHLADGLKDLASKFKV